MSEDSSFVVGDGGWSYAAHLFAPRRVVGLSVPGLEDGWQRIVVTFADGGSVEVRSHSIGSAWKLLAEAASEAP